MAGAIILIHAFISNRFSWFVSCLPCVKVLQRLSGCVLCVNAPFILYPTSHSKGQVSSWMMFEKWCQHLFNCDKNTLRNMRNDHQRVWDGDFVQRGDRNSPENILKRLWWKQHYVENTTAEISVDLGVNCSISPEGTTSSSTKHLITNKLIYEQALFHLHPGFSR